MARPFIDLAGDRFGNLLAIKNTHSSKQGRIWKCLCKCGVYIQVSTGALRSGKRKSCGCIHIGKNNVRFNGYEDIAGSYWSHIKHQARKRKLEFKITIEEAWGLYKKQERKCAISGLDINTSSSATYRSDQQTASLDRINNNEGYLMSNIQWVHKHINLMKNIYNQDYFIYLCKQVAINSNRDEATDIIKKIKQMVGKY